MIEPKISEHVRTAAVVIAAIAVDLLFWDGATMTTDGGSLPWLLPVALTAAVHQSLWWRRSHPGVVMTIQCLFGVVSLAVPLWQPFAGLLIALYSVALTMPLPMSRLALVASAVPMVAHSVGQARVSVAPLQTLVVLAALWLAAAAAAWALGRHRRGRSLRLGRWQREQDALHEQVAKAERLALARELHDGAANTITNVLMLAAIARAAGNEEMAGVEAGARRAMEEIQATLRLMPRPGEPVRGPGLDELPELYTLARAAGLDVEVTTSGTRRPLPPDVELAAYRAVQEGVTNAVKYAPGSRCRVSLDWAQDELVVSVADRPAATTAAVPVALPTTSGRGLAGLDDRLRPLGGWVESGHNGPGFRLVAGVPTPSR